MQKMRTLFNPCRAALSFSLLLSSCHPSSSGNGGARPPLDDSPRPPVQRQAPSNQEEPSTRLPLPKGSPVSFAQELKRVSRLRKLKSLRPVVGLRVDSDELLAHMERAIDFNTPPQALKGTETMLVALGVVPLKFEYRVTMLRLLSEQLAGLYDPHLQAMLIRKTLPPSEAEMTLLHELVHSLQDQNFDLHQVVQWSPDNTDRSGALSCLAEGDATSAMFDGRLEVGGKTALSLPPGFIQKKMLEAATQGPQQKQIPSIIQRSLRAPYLDGLTFVHTLRRRGGWQEVNRVWKTPPTSTEQILHLEKYDAQEPAIEVPIPLPPTGQKNWKVLLHDIWGEQGLRLLFEEWQSPREARQSAAGWGGDRIVIYKRGEEYLLAWSLVGDTAKDAKEIFNAFNGGLSEPKISGETEEVDPQSSWNYTCGHTGKDAAAPQLTIALQGSRVVVVGSPFVRKFQGSSEITRRESNLTPKNARLRSCKQAIGWISTQLSQTF